MIGTVSYLIFQAIIIFIIGCFFSVSEYYDSCYNKSKEKKISYVCGSIGGILTITFIIDLITYWIIK